MIYKCIEDLSKTIKNNIGSLPLDIDLVVANPRSGFLPATMIALYRNLPLCDIDSLNNDRIFECGITKKNNFIKSVKEAKNILIVEDSSYSGKSIELIKNKIPKTIIKKCKILTIYVNSNTKKYSDYYFEVIDEARIFEWNIFHHNGLNYAAVDLELLVDNKIIPTSKINSILINDSISKEDASKLIDCSILYDSIIYTNELEKSDVEFIITNNVEKYSKYNIKIIDFVNSKFIK